MFGFKKERIYVLDDPYYVQRKQIFDKTIRLLGELQSNREYLNIIFGKDMHPTIVVSDTYGKAYEFTSFDLRNSISKLIEILSTANDKKSDITFIESSLVLLKAYNTYFSDGIVEDKIYNSVKSKIDKIQYLNSELDSLDSFDDFLTKFDDLNSIFNLFCSIKSAINISKKLIEFDDDRIEYK